MPATLRVDDTGARAAILIAHPKGNILTAAIIADVRDALQRCAGVPGLKLISIEGQGEDFSFGASIEEHTSAVIRDALPMMHGLIAALLDAPAPTAAIVRGRCLGGGFELALACDLIFAAADAVFGLPEIALGVFPPAASVLLPLRVGHARAGEAVLTGTNRPAAYWEHAGLVAMTARASELASCVDAWFEEHLAPRSSAALRYAAAASRAGIVAQVRGTLPALERLYLDELMKTHDASEGVDAFLQKRAPRWRNE